ncbi:3'-5' exoribonuclease domain-containing protein [Pseudosulfitobacter pseudonitzschiae]|uniref:3'-5' exoribonuclease domain-containing protein n=1 Tax=Pseudosulfitobacter pseudonitzschiae TaxID=1402135 RepID=UPI003B7EFE22
MRKITGTMIDTETLALGPKALIWEIACVPFEMQIHEDHVSWDTTGEPYHAMVDYTSTSTRNFDIDFGTINWTSRQRINDAGWNYWREKHFNPGFDLKSLPSPGVPLMKPQDILFNLSWKTKDAPVWFRNSAFDAPVIENLAALTERKMPWHRRQQSDLYTLVNAAGQLLGYEDNLPSSTGHRALEDALGQIEQLADLSGMLYCGIPSTEIARDQEAEASPV